MDDGIHVPVEEFDEVAGWLRDVIDMADDQLGGWRRQIDAGAPITREQVQALRRHLQRAL